MLLLIISFIFDFVIIPSQQPEEQNHLFFLHNKFAELHPLDKAHEVYGKVEYNEIIRKFKSNGFIVHSEIRSKHTDPAIYAKKIKLEIDSLKSMGIKSNHITVAGTSKGGYIAQYVSTYVADPEINYVFIASVMKGDEIEFPEINFCGNILNIYDLSDTSFVSAIKRKESSKLKITRYKDFEINTRLSHGFVFKAMDEWITPTCEWGKRNYSLDK